MLYAQTYICDIIFMNYNNYGFEEKENGADNRYNTAISI